MSDPNQPTTWLGLNPAVLLTIAAAIGGAITKGIGAVWKAIQKGNKDVADGFREQITTLREQLAVERAERERLGTLVERLGLQKDELRNLLERERLRAAGVVYRVHQDSSVDDSLVQDMPTAVHERAKLFAGSDPHANWGADPNPAKPWEPDLSTPPGAMKPPRPRKP